MKSMKRVTIPVQAQQIVVAAQGKVFLCADPVDTASFFRNIPSSLSLRQRLPLALFILEASFSDQSFSVDKSPDVIG